MANCNDGGLGCDLQPCCCRSGFDAGYGGAVGRFSRGGVAEAMINVGRYVAAGPSVQAYLNQARCIGICDALALACVLAV